MRILVLFLSFLPGNSISAQNLLDNQGFEDLNICTEYHASCAPESWFYIRPVTNPLVNGRLVPKPLLGSNLLLLPMFDVSRRIRPLVYSMLICSIQKGKEYKLNFYVHSSGKNFYNIDIAFLQQDPISRDFDTYQIVPDIKIGPEHIVGTVKEWQAVEYIFTAGKDAQFMLMGNINSFAGMAYAAADAMNKQGMIYYFVDEIQLRPMVPEAICPQAEKNITAMRIQDFRHTEYATIDIPPHKESPAILTDTILLPSVLFKTNSDIIEPKFAGILDSLVNKLANTEVQSMQITGHTDNTGNYERNLILSQNRAIAVKNYLLAIIPVENISTEGKADTMPIADNLSVEGRSKNRRVELIISYQQKE
jgi:outer membrane protein OmpA-like peptidoglycan-associated protein